MADKYTFVNCGDGDRVPTSKCNIAFFDLDHTLITPKGKTVFPKNVEDWKWKNKEILPRLRELCEQEGFRIVIITNQKRLSPEDTERKARLIHADMRIPFVLIAGHKDEYYRKPHTGLWKEVVVKKLLGGKRSLLDGKKSFFCGDMESDALFAKNVGLKFVHTDAFFLGKSDVPALGMGQHPLDGLVDDTFVSFGEAKTLVVMVGAPASGKSTLARSLESEQGFVRINKDEMKTDTKMKKAFAEALNASKNVVIDNTNATLETRRQWIDEAKAQGYHTEIVWMDLPKQAVEYLNHYRVEAAKSGSVMIPSVAFRVFYSKFVPPNSTECDHLTVLRGVSAECFQKTKNFWA